MIKKSIFEAELVSGMQKELVKNASTYESTHVEKAVDYLNSAIDIFEDAGMQSQADKILKILKKIADSNTGLSLNKLLEYNINPNDIKEISTNPAARARINIALRNSGHSDQEIISLVGQVNFMPLNEIEELSKNYSLKQAQDMNDAKKHRNPAKINDSHTKGLSSDKMTKNLLDHGTVFNMADDGFADDLLNIDVDDHSDLSVEEHSEDKTFEDED